MDEIIAHHINGEAVYQQNRLIPLHNPATGKIMAHVDCADQALIKKAVISAQNAQLTWGKLPAMKRAKILRDFAQKIEKEIDTLAHLITQEHGKTLEDAKASIQRGLEILHYHAGIAHQLQGSFSHQVSSDVHTHTFYQPLGICAGVAPFNFPVMVPMWMMIPAIACGNAFILKPSEKVPSASLQLARWFEETGLPKGILQIIQGDAKTVQLLLEHPDIKAYTAVGSTRAAHHIYQEATQRGKRAHTFGGAKNHAVVMPDAPIEHAAHQIVSAAFGSAGQRCMAISAVIAIGDDTANRLKALMLPLIENIKVGDGMLPGIDMGPVISLQQKDALLNDIQIGVHEGAELILDGRSRSFPNEGYFLGPCLFDHVQAHMQIYQKELFGPILVMLRVNTFDEALNLLNQHRYGNGGVIFTRSGGYAQQFSERVECGMIGVNIPIPVPIVTHPFGGWKQSSFGDRPMHALESIHFYSQQKTVTTTWPQQDENLISFNMPNH